MSKPSGRKNVPIGSGVVWRATRPGLDAGTYIYGWGQSRTASRSSVINFGKQPVLLNIDFGLDVRPEVAMVAAGRSYVHILINTGELYSWGTCTYGELGHGESFQSLEKPQKVPFSEGKIRRITSGNRHCAMTTTDGDIYTWGNGDNGKLGHGDSKSYSRPRLLFVLQGRRASDICCGWEHTVVLIERSGQNTEVFSFGQGKYGQTGHGDKMDRVRPEEITELSKLRPVCVRAGPNFSALVTFDGKVYTFGDNSNGQLGINSTVSCASSPTELDFNTFECRIIDVACGRHHALALSITGEVFSWGLSDYGQMGMGRVKSSLRPRRIEFLYDKNISTIHCGEFFSGAVTCSGWVYTWGRNDLCQLGHNTFREPKIHVRSENDVSDEEFPRLVQTIMTLRCSHLFLGMGYALAVVQKGHLNAIDFSIFGKTQLEKEIEKKEKQEMKRKKKMLAPSLEEMFGPKKEELPTENPFELSTTFSVENMDMKRMRMRSTIRSSFRQESNQAPSIGCGDSERGVRESGVSSNDRIDIPSMITPRRERDRKKKVPKPKHSLVDNIGKYGSWRTANLRIVEHPSLSQHDVLEEFLSKYMKRMPAPSGEEDAPSELAIEPEASQVSLRTARVTYEQTGPPPAVRSTADWQKPMKLAFYHANRAVLANQAYGYKEAPVTQWTPSRSIKPMPRRRRKGKSPRRKPVAGRRAGAGGVVEIQRLADDDGYGDDDDECEGAPDETASQPGGEEAYGDDTFEAEGEEGEGDVDGGGEPQESDALEYHENDAGAVAAQPVA